MGSVSLGAQPIFTQPRKWFRTWSDEHSRYFYWDSVTSQSTWDMPPVTDIIIDHVTMQEVVRETAATSPAPVISTTNVLSAFGSQSSSSVLQHTADPNLLTSKPKINTTADALKAVLLTTNSASVSAMRQVKPINQPVISAEKLKEIEEADRKLAEQLQAEMDKEFEETKATMPSPAEALAMLRQKKSKTGKLQTASGNSEDLVKDMAQQGFTVKVSKKKK